MYANKQQRQNHRQRQQQRHKHYFQISQYIYLYVRRWMCIAVRAIICAHSRAKFSRTKILHIWQQYKQPSQYGQNHRSNSDSIGNERTKRLKNTAQKFETNGYWEPQRDSAQARQFVVRFVVAVDQPTPAKWQGKTKWEILRFTLDTDGVHVFFIDYAHVLMRPTHRTSNGWLAAATSANKEIHARARALARKIKTNIGCQCLSNAHS